MQNALGQQDAAQTTLVNAQTVQKDAEARLNHGLATLPDVLEATAAAAQVDYDLQAALGAVKIAQGDLASTLALPAATKLRVETIDALSIPDVVTETAD